MAAKQPPHKQYAALVAQTKLTRSAFAALVGVRRECITRRCSGAEKFRAEALLAARYLVEVEGL